MVDDELPDWVKPGASFNWLKRKYHVRAIVDGGAVCRFWMATKQRWHYERIAPFAFIGDTTIERALARGVETGEGEK